MMSTVQPMMSTVPPYRTTQENLQIWVFATKHGMTVAQVEQMLVDY